MIIVQKKFTGKKYAILIDANTKELLGIPVELPQSCGHFAYIEPIKSLLLKGIYG